MPWVERAAVDWGHWDLSSWMARPLPDVVVRRFAGNPDAFDIRFLEDLLTRLGDDADLLAQLGQLYTETGRYREGLGVDRRLIALRPRDPVAYYNLACSYSLLKQSNRAFAALKKAIHLGYRDIEHMVIDRDLAHLRKDPRWQDLVSVMKL